MSNDFTEIPDDLVNLIQSALEADIRPTAIRDDLHAIFFKAGRDHLMVTIDRGMYLVRTGGKVAESVASLAQSDLLQLAPREQVSDPLTGLLTEVIWRQRPLPLWDKPSLVWGKTRVTPEKGQLFVNGELMELDEVLDLIDLNWT